MIVNRSLFWKSITFSGVRFLIGVRLRQYVATFGMQNYWNPRCTELQKTFAARVAKMVRSYWISSEARCST
jgi:hypothetical protein